MKAWIFGAAVAQLMIKPRETETLDRNTVGYASTLISVFAAAAGRWIAFT